MAVPFEDSDFNRLLNGLGRSLVPHGATNLFHSPRFSQLIMSAFFPLQLAASSASGPPRCGARTRNKRKQTKKGAAGRRGGRKRPKDRTDAESRPCRYAHPYALTRPGDRPPGRSHHTAMRPRRRRRRPARPSRATPNIGSAAGSGTAEIWRLPLTFCPATPEVTVSNR